jgi:hypothetical protein
VLRSASKCSRTDVYAPLLNRIAPCSRTKSGVFNSYISAGSHKVIFGSIKLRIQEFF